MVAVGVEHVAARALRHPGAELVVVAGELAGGEQAAAVMREVGQQETGARLADQYECQGQPVYSTARLWDDGVIDPRSTRDVLASALAACGQSALSPVDYGVFRM